MEDMVVPPEIRGEIKRELVAEGPASTSTSTTKVRREDVKDRGSSMKTRGNHAVMRNIGDMFTSSSPCNRQSRIVTFKRSQKAKELASQEEACRAQLDKLCQSWNQKDVRTSLLQKEAAIRSSLASLEQNLQSVISHEHEKELHLFRSRALMAALM
ncbi:hypothetical protein T459_29733 [Capsicum annuum]|uniref:Uncharacterized protein n=1 Tax=Capsicum annuum TaxID=4072 RepID=A0A2G2Y6F7_CAPAN|nr:hypothetical protein T459_29733 [Capsicum annuum]